MTNVDLFELFNQGIVKPGAHNVNVPIKKLAEKIIVVKHT